MEDNETVLKLLERRLKSHRKKYKRILELEHKELTLNKDQEQLLRSKHIVAALVKEYSFVVEKLNLSQVSAMPPVNQNRGEEEKRVKKKKKKKKKKPKSIEERMAAESRESRANHAAKCMRDNRTSMKNVLTRWNSFLEIQVDVKRYIDVVNTHIYRIKSEIDLNDELKILESLYNKLDLVVVKSKIETIRADLSYDQAAVEIIKMPGVKDLISSDPKILNDDHIRKVILSYEEFELYDWQLELRQRIEEQKEYLDELLARIKDRESELKDQQQTVESLLDDQNEKEAYQLRDKTEMEVNTLENKEVMKNHLVSLNEQLASAISRMTELDENFSDLFGLHRLSHRLMLYCRARLSSHSRKLSGKEEPKPEDSVTEPEDQPFA